MSRKANMMKQGLQTVFINPFIDNSLLVKELVAGLTNNELEQVVNSVIITDFDCCSEWRHNNPTLAMLNVDLTTSEEEDEE
ncbi:hypothetical protein PHYBLDRAFT_152573 [Phycomyces blakesleeanus NRRL 1555(-)]|uniref:Uncharacterized protein n=1 Tax=Phycomyces blakesleeanus (strain ATCC 8743b / DSM 1359 / FGSC 10004 / NBRC 33097 / NRRL 1555) TaxID=763407 RepID=A0A167JLF5_PHYB8|nr:hypothetical protein PHYBLDRAFT_152573 [Phycomyces blakesleeanus NRRL 1555(-)]OAD66248.1 hypothetical protein PHYBLDRAFT_152573 [Phycomyces blakesleeanus NRRL 1555(-)]|eukprot:XP_018284288.1 hypothetical protein PHYBLDRAFT_152573 [Phycomyces blakesleeanus NRRL 1555(-)]